MPELYIHVRWPDMEEFQVYSPSSIVEQYFHVGDTYSVADFETKAKEALNHASRRVEEVYGYQCSSAMASLSKIHYKAQSFTDQSGLVTVLNIQ